MRNIKELIDEDNYLVVLDTNILLEMYRFSPDYADFDYSGGIAPVRSGAPHQRFSF